MTQVSPRYPRSKHIPRPCKFNQDKLVVKLDELIPSDTQHVEGAVSRVLALLEKSGCRHDLGNVQLALQEALMNAVLHGNRSDPEKYVRLCVAVEEDGEVLIVVKDSGRGFDPSKLPDPTKGQNIYRDCGRGVYLIHQLMDEVHYEFEDGTSVIMRHRPPNGHK